MARQVYYDPFGSRLAGYQAGVNDEVQMQDQTRRARASDWDYNNIAPLQLSQAQRAESLGQFADPYMRNQYGINQRMQLANLFGAEQPQYERIGQATGNYSPALVNANNYGSGMSLGSEQFFAPQVRQAYDTISQNPAVAEQAYIEQLSQLFGIDPRAFQAYEAQQTGMLSPAAERGYDQFLGYDRTRQMGLDNRLLNADTWLRQYQQQQLQQQTDQLAQSEAWRRSQYGGGANGAAAPAGAYTGAEDGF